VCLKEKGGTGVVGGLGLWIDDVPGLNSFLGTTWLWAVRLYLYVGECGWSIVVLP
jgi:hypothetical protein